jgi:hypothetical protein
MDTASPSRVAATLRSDLGTASKLVAEAIVDSYPDARDLCAGLRAATRRDTLSHMRRACVETRVGQAFERSGADVQDLVAGDDASRHIQIAIGRLILTIHAVNERSDLPRDAVFRDTAARSAQANLFMSEIPPPSDARIYAFVLYGPRAGDCSFPSFITVMAPNGACTEIVGIISLHEELSAALVTRAAREGEQNAIEVVADETNVTVREPPEEIVERPPVETVRDVQLTLSLDPGATIFNKRSE